MTDKIKEAYKIIDDALHELFPTISDNGQFRLDLLLDEAHWLLFEREPNKAVKKKGKMRVAWAGSVLADIIVKITVIRGERRIPISKARQKELEWVACEIAHKVMDDE